MGKRVLLGVVGAIPGGLVGAGIGLFSGYGLAELLGVSSSEAQAYFQGLVAFPVFGLVGLATGATAAASIPGGSSRAPFLAVAGLGVLSLLATCGVGLAWNDVSRPARFRVRNEAPAAIENAYLGHDFRRATSLGDLAPATTTTYHEVDLDQRGSFNAVRGLYEGSQIQLTLEADRQASLVEGDFTYVVKASGSGLSLELSTDE